MKHEHERHPAIVPINLSGPRRPRSEDRRQVEAAIVLCEQIAVSEEKMHVVGAAWGVAPAFSEFDMGVFCKITIPRELELKKHRFVLRLLTIDGLQVKSGTDEVRIDRELVASTFPASGLNGYVTLADHHRLNLPPGDYQWELQVDAAILARATFSAVTVHEQADIDFHRWEAQGTDVERTPEDSGPTLVAAPEDRLESGFVPFLAKLSKRTNDQN